MLKNLSFWHRARSISCLSIRKFTPTWKVIFLGPNFFFYRSDKKKKRKRKKRERERRRKTVPFLSFWHRVHSILFLVILTPDSFDSFPLGPRIATNMKDNSFEIHLDQFDERERDVKLLPKSFKSLQSSELNTTQLNSINSMKWALWSKWRSISFNSDQRCIHLNSSIMSSDK